MEEITARWKRSSRRLLKADIEGTAGDDLVMITVARAIPHPHINIYIKYYVLIISCISIDI